MRTFGIKFSLIAVHHSAREGKPKTVIAQGASSKYLCIRISVNLLMELLSGTGPFGTYDTPLDSSCRRDQPRGMGFPEFLALYEQNPGNDWVILQSSMVLYLQVVFFQMKF